MLAIVIPYYKYTFFELTLLSLKNQTDRRFKVYIGDDASPENPSLLLDKYKNSLNFDYQRFVTNLGSTSLVNHWERCVQMSNHEEWIIILGDDDVLDENCVALFYENIEQVDSHKINVIRYSTLVINQDGAELSKVYLHPKLEDSTDFLIRRFKGYTRSSMSEYVFRKSTMQEIGFKDLPLAWHTDVLAVLEFSKFGLVYTINEVIVRIRLSGINISSKTDDFILKNKATFAFYSYLLQQYGGQFSKKLLVLLFDKLEKTILDNKKEIIYWGKLFYLYIKFLMLIRLMTIPFKVLLYKYKRL